MSMTLEELIEKEIQLEKEYQDDYTEKAIEMYKYLSTERASVTGKGKAILQSLYPVLSEAYTVMMNKTKIPEAVREVIKVHTPEKLCAITVMSVLQTLIREFDIQFSKLCKSVGTIIETETQIMKVKQIAPRYQEAVEDYIKERRIGNTSHILTTYRKALEQLGEEYTSWGGATRARIGAYLLRPLKDMNFIHTELRCIAPPKTAQFVYINEEVKLFITELPRVYTIKERPPMIVKPNKITSLHTQNYLILKGGIWSNKRNIKENTNEANRYFIKNTMFKNILNNIQETPYQINKFILDVMNNNKKYLFTMDKQPEPIFIYDGIPKETWDEAMHEEFRMWKTRKRDYYFEEKQRLSKLYLNKDVLDMANKYSEYERIYFPISIDWRYRIYFKSRINPQGSDINKALIQYAEGKELGDRGLFWLKVHVANCYGFDKELFEYRAKWTDSNMDIIRDVVKRHVETEAFNEADSPFMFLAACKELVDALDSPNPDKFVSKMIVSMDATNSGGQHFAAILRDEVGGRLCNLVWEGQPQKMDLYGDVAARTEAKVKKDSLDNPDMVELWTINKIDRKLCKKPTMTFFYAATDESCKEYIREHILKNGFTQYKKISHFKAICYITPKIRSSIKEANPKAAELMKALKDAVAKMTTPARWFTPLGLLVINYYPKYKVRYTKVASMGVVKIAVIEDKLDEVDVRKSANSIAPNFIHSLDSTHLALTCHNFKGMFTPVHDSFGSHACDIDDLHVATRESFIGMYENNNPLESLEKECGISIPVTKGNLNLNSIRDAVFFFC